MAAEIDQTKQMRAHEGTYSFFTGLVKWGTIAAAILTFIVIMLIT